MEYLKFTLSFLNTLQLEESGVAEIDAELQGNLKNFLLYHNSFATSVEDLETVKNEIEYVYKNLLETILPKYTATLDIVNKKTKRDKTILQEYGNETNSSAYFEPIENGTQAKVLNGETTTTWLPDNTTESETVDENTENDAMVKLYNDITFLIRDNFKIFINIYY